MPVFVTLNSTALAVESNLASSRASLDQALLRLSSGKRINGAADDAAGLAISSRLQNQLNGLQAGIANATAGISLANVADAALAQVVANLQRVRTLAIQAANSTNSATDRVALDLEVQQRLAEVQRIASQTQYNGGTLLNGTFAGAAFQVGANVGQAVTLSAAAQNVQINAIGATVSATGTATVTSAVETYSTAGQAIGVSFAPSATGTLATGPLATAGGSSYQGVSGQAIAGNTLQLNGTFVSASSAYAGSNPYQDATSAYAKAAAINGSDLPGLTATASTSLTFDGTGNLALGAPGNSNWYTGSVTGNGILGYQLLVNGTPVAALTVSDYGGPTAGVISNAQVVSGVNAASSQTGVSAVANANGTISFNAADGRTIVLQEVYTPNDLDTTTFIAASQLGTATLPLGIDGTLTNTATYRGQVTLSSSASVVIGTPAGAPLIGWTAGTSGIAASGSLAGQNAQTLSAAASLVYATDSALTTVNAYRATYGSLVNRLTSVVGAQQSQVQQLSSANGRITDTDYASEATALSVAQIVQQAGIALAAQANAMPQAVLKLLQ